MGVDTGERQKGAGLMSQSQPPNLVPESQPNPTSQSPSQCVTLDECPDISELRSSFINRLNNSKPFPKL